MISSHAPSAARSSLRRGGWTAPPGASRRGAAAKTGAVGEAKAAAGSQACGDGFVGEGEACDHGNDVPDDGCTDTCALPSCGDGIVQSPEACDDANEENTDDCV